MRSRSPATKSPPAIPTSRSRRPQRASPLRGRLRALRSTFPDAFLSPSGRVYLDPKEKQDKGRLLSAGFHQHDGLLPRRRPALRADPRRRTAGASSTLSGTSSTSSPSRRCGSTPASSGSSGPSSAVHAGTEFDFARAEDKDVDDRGEDQAARRGLPGQGPEPKPAAATQSRSRRIEDFFDVNLRDIRRRRGGQLRRRAEPSRGAVELRRAGLSPAAVAAGARTTCSPSIATSPRARTAWATRTPSATRSPAS